MSVCALTCCGARIMKAKIVNRFARNIVKATFIRDDLLAQGYLLFPATTLCVINDRDNDLSRSR